MAMMVSQAHIAQVTVPESIRHAFPCLGTERTIIAGRKLGGINRT